MNTRTDLLNYFIKEHGIVLFVTGSTAMEPSVGLNASACNPG